MAEDIQTEESAELEDREAGLAGALKNLADGLSGLVRNQFELIRIEAKHEATEAGTLAGKLTGSAIVALLGYGFLLMALVFGVGWLGYGVGAMALCATLVGLAHLIAGLVGIRTFLAKFEQQQERLEQMTRKRNEADKWQETSREN